MAPAPSAAVARTHSGSIWRWAVVAFVLVVALHLVAGRPGGAYAQRIILLAGINIILAVSLNVINGITGQFSIGHAGFMAVGAYVSAAFTVFLGTWLETRAAHGHLDPNHPVLNLFLVGTPGVGVQLRAQAWFACALLAGGLSAALCGVLVGIPTLRLRGDYLAIATLGFGEIVRAVLVNLEQVGGASGFTGAPPFYKIPSYTTVLNVYLAAMAAIFAVTALKRSNLGRALEAIRDDDVAAEAVGIDTTRFKVRAFAFSAFFAGVAGGLLAHFLPLIIPSQTMFGFMRSIEVIAFVVLGGSGSTTGAVLAAAILTVLPERLRDLESWRMVLYAEVLIVMMLFRRQGLLGTREITDRDWTAWGRFLRQNGLRGLLRTIRGTLRERLHALHQRLWPAGRRTPSGWLALVLLALPWLDFLIFLPALLEMITRPAGGHPAAWAAYAGTPPRTLLADLANSLTALVPQTMRALPLLKPVATDLQFPLAANAGLSLALLPLLIPWSALCWAVAGERKRSAWGLVPLLALGLWHGGGLLASHHGSARAVAEAGASGALLLWLLVWLLKPTGRAT